MWSGVAESVGGDWDLGGYLLHLRVYSSHSSLIPDMKLLFASSNPHKIEEVARILGPGFDLSGPGAVGFTREVPENENTFEGNALLKASALYAHCSKLFGEGAVGCFADDSGLEVDALGGAPGVWSARYAGETDPGLRDQANIQLLLRRMEGFKEQTARSARFRTVVAFIHRGRHWFFEGKVEGYIAFEPKGSGGFGYDPVFVPEGYAKHFSELTMEEKNRISHRGEAVRRFAEFLQSYREE